jgi:hypothetical protein
LKLARCGINSALGDRLGTAVKHDITRELHGVEFIMRPVFPWLTLDNLEVEGVTMLPGMPDFVKHVEKPAGDRRRALLQCDDVASADAPTRSVERSRVCEWEHRHPKVPNKPQHTVECNAAILCILLTQYTAHLMRIIRRSALR